jgi:SagB-type dehydrogenase family enzyme
VLEVEGNGEMPNSLLLAFKQGISLTQAASNDFVLHSSTGKLNLKQPSPGLIAAIAILSTSGATEAELSELVIENDGGATLPQLYYYLQQFINLGLICHTVRADAVSLATAIPIATPYNFQVREAELDKQYVLSRFAYCHTDNMQMVWETPLFPAQIIVSARCGAAAIAALAQPQDCYSLSEILGVTADTARIFFSLLLSTKLVAEVDAEGKIQAEENHPLAQWEFHDLLFHARSRYGRHAHPVGKTYRFLGKIKPLPAVKPKLSHDVIELYKPDIENLKAADYPFTQILEERKSLRIHGDKPISDRQLGEFLYRSARIREIVSREFIECSKRPYPSGGAAYELELYIAIETCENIPSGLYHYCPLEHQLEKISGRNSHVAALLEAVGKATGENILPQILIIFAARFARVSWVYESMAYSLILKHVGVLYQTMYLVATAMNLAACGLGSGNSELFSTVAGTDYYTESSVGEFILGSKFTT